MVKITNINDKRLRRKICIDTFSINPFAAQELWCYMKTNNLDRN